MAIKGSLFLLTILVIGMSKDHTSSQFDMGSLSSTSPFSSPIMWSSIPETTLEFGLTNYHSFTPSVPEAQLFDTKWGVLWGKGLFRYSGTLSYIEAFSIYHKISPEINVAVSLNEHFTLGSSLGASLLWIPQEHDTEFQLGIGGAYHNSTIHIGGMLNVYHLSRDPKRSIPLGEITLILALSETSLGNQALKAVWNHTDNTGHVLLTESFPITPWWNIGVSLKSHIFEIGLSTVFSFGKTNTGFHFSRHPELGWSQSGAVQIFPQRE